MISAPRDIKVTVGETTEFTVRATDPEDGEVEIVIMGGIKHEADFNANTGIFTWTPSHIKEVEIR